MALILVSYETATTDVTYIVSDIYSRGQTFTTGDACQVDIIQLRLGIQGSCTGYYKVSLYNTSAGLPTTEISNSGLRSIADLPWKVSGNPFDWLSIEMPTTSLSGSTMYAITLETTSLVVPSGQGVGLMSEQTSPTYAGGTVLSRTSPGSWTSSSATDNLFRVCWNGGTSFPYTFNIDFTISGTFRIVGKTTVGQDNNPCARTN